MGDASLDAIEPHSSDSIQRSDTSGEHRAEKDHTKNFLANQEGFAKDLASACENAPEGLLSTETSVNPVHMQNGNQAVIEDACIELENKSNTVPMEDQAPLGQSSMQCEHKSVSGPEKHLEVKELTDTPSIVVSSVNEKNNGRDVSENELDFKKKIETEDRSANCSRFHNFGSTTELPFESNGTQEAMGDTGLHDQGHKDVSNFRLTETPMKFVRGADDLEVFATVDGECLATNTIRTSLQAENMDDVKISKNNEISETGPAESPINIEQGKNICPNGDEINDPKEGTQKVGTVVHESEFSGMHNDGKSENDEKQSWSWVGTFGCPTEVAVHPTLNESCLESRPDSNADKDLHRHAYMDERKPSTISEEEQSFNISSWGWLDQGSPSSIPVTALVSDDIKGWHRFDIEEENAKNTIYGGGVPNLVSQQPELWEQLLEDGVEAGQEAKENEENISSVVLSGRESPASDHNFQIGLTSPGNPFLEGLDRLSNFSEAEGFVFNNNLPSSRFSQSLETAASLCVEEDSRSAANEQEGFLSGANHDSATTSGKQEIIAPEMGRVYSSASRLVAPFGNKLQPEANRHSTGSSRVSSELFEAPSFMSLVDPESHELFKASMPTYGGKSNLPSQENGGEKWVANFDSVMPSQPQILSPQEITRSKSLPRVNTGGVSASEAPGVQSPVTSPSSKRKQAFSPSKIWNSLSRKSLTPSASPKSGSSLASPKLTPLVKKMVQKVRTTPGIAMHALHTTSKVMSPKTEDNKSKQRPLWACCTCFYS